jgi:hypothetical protein
MRIVLGAGLVLAALTTSAFIAYAGSGKSRGNVGGSNQPPVCCFGPDCQQTGLTEIAECGGDETSFVLDATGSFDPEGQPLKFLWESCPGSTIDDPTSPLTILRIDTSSDCTKNCGVRLRVNDGKHETYCRLFVQVVPAPEGCTYTQGFWKTHGPGACGVAAGDNQWPVDSLELGDTTYTDAELCSIFWTPPAGGNGLISLAHQLIAAEFNKANGASVPAVVADALEDAHALIGALVIPPVGGGYLPASTTSGLNNVLAAYNEGLIEGSVHCDD